MRTAVQPDTIKVLIVDDQPRNLDALEAMLGATPCLCVRAQSADEALLCLLRDDFAAIILDIRMPGMNGIELAKLIKQRKRTRDVPILFLTAHLADEDDVLLGYGVGAVDYLSKPFNPDILRSKVGVFIELFRKNRELGQLNTALEAEITERRRIEEALYRANHELETRVEERTAALTRAHAGVRENEERLRMAMAVAQLGGWEWNLTTGQMAWSTDPEALFGLPTGSLGPDMRLFRALHPDDRARMEEAVRVALETGGYEDQYRVIRPDASIVWIRERGRVVSSADGTPEKMVGVSRDVTAQHEYEQEREWLLASARTALNEAEHQSRLKDDFLATLSHELRTPMNAILGWLSILESGKPIREVHSALSVVQRNAQLQAKLIDDLLDMNRLMSGNLRLEVAPSDLGALVHATMQALQPAADAKTIHLIAAVDTSAATVSADSRRLQQVLWNLVHNAIKFTPCGGRVEIRVMRPGGNGANIQITVQDTGRGISKAFLPHVFERFRQEDAGTLRVAPGLGLGLSIAKHLVELHGGTISAESEGEGRGATFVIDLPIAAARDEAASA